MRKIVSCCPRCDNGQDGRSQEVKRPFSMDQISKKNLIEIDTSPHPC